MNTEMIHFSQLSLHGREVFCGSYGTKEMVFLWFPQNWKGQGLFTSSIKGPQKGMYSQPVKGTAAGAPHKAREGNGVDKTEREVGVGGK